MFDCKCKETSVEDFVEHFGIKLRIDPLYMSEKMIKVIREKRYELEEARHITKFLHENEIVLEIGAGIGFVTTLLAKNPLTKRIVSYEANPTLINHFRETVTTNLTADQMDRLEIRNAVLKTGPAGGSVDFYIHNDFWASSLLPIPDPLRIEKVKVENFNAVVAELRPTLIVCDIEGGELSLFKNADLTGVKKVYLEAHQNQLGRRGMKSLFEIFHARDFHYDQHHSERSVVLFSHVDR